MITGRQKLRPLRLEIPEEKVYEVKREIRNIFPKKWDKGLASVKEMYDEIINALSTVYSNYGRITQTESTNDKISINTKKIYARRNE